MGIKHAKTATLPDNPNKEISTDEWNAEHVGCPASLTLWLTNRTGNSLAEGDVVIVDATNAESVITTTTANYTRGVGVIKTGGNNLDLVEVFIAGYIPKMLTTAAEGAGLGQFLGTSTTGKKAALGGTTGAKGHFATAITNADANGYLKAIFKTPEIY